MLTNTSSNIAYGNVIHNNNVGFLLSTEISTDYKPPTSHNKISNNTIFNNKIGIKLARFTTFNQIEYNNMSGNIIGIYLKDHPNNNIIAHNILKKNFIQAIFIGCTTNTWHKNYWNRPRFLPKAIFGIRTVKNIPIPWVNYDKNPSQQIL